MKALPSYKSLMSSDLSAIVSMPIRHMCDGCGHIGTSR